MPGGQYGTQNGLSYGQQGGQYGDLQFGTRIELYEPGEIGPAITTSSQSSVSIGLEHSTVSDMEVELPPHSDITIDRFRSGRMTYHSGGRLLFSAEIEGLSTASDRMITLSGDAVEDTPLTRNQLTLSFADTTMADAIREVGERLPHDVRVRPSPERPVTDKLTQTADVGTGFEGILQEGQDIEFDDRSTWRQDLPQFGKEDVINTLHATTPLKTTTAGLTLSQTCTVLEAQNFDEDNGIPILVDEAASGARCVEFVDLEDWVEWSFGFEHTIPANHVGISIRGRVATGASGSDRIRVEINGTTEKDLYTGRTWGAGDYFWASEAVTPSDPLDAADGPDDNPHTIRLEKVEGSKAVRIDCVAIFDRRFEHPTPDFTDVDENNALSEPGLYPHGCVATFDLAPTGALLDHARMRATGVWRGVAPFGALGFLVPASNFINVGFQLISSDEDQQTVENSGDIPEDPETSRVFGFVRLGGTTLTDEDEIPTTTPTTFSEAQTITDVRLFIDGSEEAIISDERDFQDTPMSILQTMHGDSGRRFTIEHGVRPDQGPPVIRSFETRDSREIRSTSDWILTDVQRDVDVSDYANQVTVIGAPLVPGSAVRARATARDDGEIDRLADPPDDDGVRPIEIEDDSLETVNDCVSKARAILRERVYADKRGGSITTAPVLPTPGPQYLTEFLGADSVGGWGMDWGLSWSATRTGHHSALESATYSESSGSAETSMEFEKYSGLYEVVTEI